MPKHKKTRKPRKVAKFTVGQPVRVRHGVLDEEHPDMPMGGWAGTVAEVDDRHGLCLVRWSPETLLRIHPIYKKRCAIEGADFKESWLPEGELEPDPGGPLCIEQPSRIEPRPLSADDQGDRVRMVFELTSDDFLPRADEDSLETYYDYLEERLSLPIEATYWEEVAPFRSLRRNVKIVGLDREIGWDDSEGILCKIVSSAAEDVVPLADLEVRRSKPDGQLIGDYSEWFYGNLAEDSDDDEWHDSDLDDEDESGQDSDDGYLEDDEVDEQEEGLVPMADASLWSHFLWMFSLSTFAGAVLGPAIATMTWARWSIGIGAAVMGLGMTIVAVRRPTTLACRDSRSGGVVAAAIAGLGLGALLGAMVVAFIGAGLGFVAWLLLGRLFPAGRRPAVFDASGSGLAAAGCGVVTEAFYLDPQAATSGFFYAASIGLGCGVLICLSSLLVGYFVSRKTCGPRFWRVRR